VAELAREIAADRQEVPRNESPSNSTPSLPSILEPARTLSRLPALRWV